MQIVNGPSILVFVGAVLAAIGVFWQANNQIKSEQELRKKADRIAELTIKNAELTTRNKDIIIGGNSFCYMSIGFPVKMPNKIDRWILTKGDYPLYDVQMKILDLEEFSKIDFSKTPINERLSKIRNCENIGHLGNFGISKALSLERLSVPSEKASVRFMIDFSARNGTWRQQISVKRKKEGGWMLASQVYRGDEILIDEVSKDFPRNEKGEIDW